MRNHRLHLAHKALGIWRAVCLSRAIGLFVVVLSITDCGSFFAEEVSRQRSPDGALVAILTETNAGFMTSIDYRVYLAGTSDFLKTQVAVLVGSTRSDRAYGANLRWTSATSLDVEFATADRARLVRKTIRIGDRIVRVALRPGVIYMSAPPGAMGARRRPPSGPLILPLGR